MLKNILSNIKFLLGILLLTAFLSLSLGSNSWGWNETINSLLDSSKAIMHPQNISNQNEHVLIIINHRLPRTILGIIAGAALACSGTLLQGLTKNNLAESGILGINSGCALGMSLAIYFGLALTTSQLIPFAICGGLLVGLLVIWLGVKKFNNKPLVLILSGAAVTTLLQALNSIVILFNNEALGSNLGWLSASLANKNLTILKIIVPLFLAGIGLAFLSTRSLNLLNLSSELAAGVGVNIKIEIIKILLAVALLSATATAISGPIIFFGLLIPNLIRIFIGNQNFKKQLSLAIWWGAILMLLCDIFGRIILRPAEINVGLTISLLGSMIFIFTLQKSEIKAS